MSRMYKYVAEIAIDRGVYEEKTFSSWAEARTHAAKHPAGDFYGAPRVYIYRRVIVNRGGEQVFDWEHIGIEEFDTKTTTWSDFHGAPRVYRGACHDRGI